MYKTRNAPFFRLTALGLSATLVGLTFAPLASAQPAPAGPSTTSAAKPAKEAKPAKPAPAPAPAKKPADPAAAKAPDAKTRDNARKAYSAGEKAFGEGKYSAAHDNFVKADALIPAPHAKYWIAKSIDKQDKTEDAIAAYEKFLAEPEAAKVGDEKLLDARTRLDELKAKLIATISVVTNPIGATVTVDGTPEPGVTPLTLKLSPGLHKVSVSLANYDNKDLDIDAKAGDKSEQKLELVAKAPPPVAVVVPVAAEAMPPPPPPPPPEKRSMVPAYVTLGIAGAGAIVGTIFGVKALNSKSEFNDNPTTELADDTERNALIADMAFGVAITLGVTGVVLLTSGDDPKEAAKATTKSPYKLDFGGFAGKQRGGASARLTF